MLNIQPNGDCRLTTTDAQGISKTSQVDTFKVIESVNTSTEGNKSSVNRAYTDPGTGEWVTSVWDGSSYIYPNLPINYTQTLVENLANPHKY